MVQFEKACVNNRNISSKSENLAKVSTAQCSRLKRKSQSWEKFESELRGLTDIDKGIKQISNDVDHLHSHLERVETLLEEVCVLDISLQHLKWERKLENSLKSHKQLESVKLLRKQGEKRASDLSKDISSNFLVYCAAHPHPQQILPIKGRRPWCRSTAPIVLPQ